MWKHLLLFILKIFLFFIFIFCMTFMVELIFFDDSDYCEGGKALFSNSDIVLCIEGDKYYLEKRE